MASPLKVPGDPAPELQYRSATGRWVIAACVLGSGVASLDATVVGIALPTIGRDFHVGLGPLQWVTTGYTLTLAAFLLLGGTLGDRLGRRKVFSLGVAWFAVASAACSLAPNATVLIITRAAQGIGGALLIPGSLSILQASFAADDRGQAIGAWSGLGGVTAAAGPLVGGYLLAVASWRAVFYVNIPIAIVVLLVAARHVPESRDPADPRDLGRIDWAGAGVAVIALGTLTYGLIQGPTSGWASPTVVAMLATAAVAVVAFVVLEGRRAHPMLPLGIFRDRQLSATNGVTFVIYAALGGALFLLPVTLQIVDRYSPLESGLALLPVTIIMLVFSARSGRLAGRIGPRLQMAVGPMVVAAGLALLTRAANGADYATFVLPAVIVFGSGLAITVAPLTAAAMAAAPPEHAGLASAVNNDVARIGGLLAVALLPTLAGLDGASYLHAAALAAGFRTAVFIAAAACAAGGGLAALLIRNPPRGAGTASPPGLLPPETDWHHCALGAPPLQPPVLRPDPAAVAP